MLNNERPAGTEAEQRTNADVRTSSHSSSNTMLYAACLHPMAVCDGDAGGIMEGKFEKFFDKNGVKYEKCYNLYKEKKDLSKYQTIAFYTTHSFPQKIAKILDFDKSKLKTLIVISEYAYDLCKITAKELGIKIFVYDFFNEKIIDGYEYFGY